MIDHLGGVLQKNLIVFVAVVLLPLKWIIVRVCKDPEAEAVALISVPEDLCYVTLGLVLGDMVNSAGAFHKHFAGSEHVSMDIMITVGINLLVALGVHRLSQWSMSHFKNWRAAGSARTADNPQQGNLDIPNAGDNITMIMLRHLFMFSTGYAGQLALVLVWLHWVAKVVANG